MRLRAADRRVAADSRMALTTAAKPIGSRFCASPAQRRFLRRIVLHAFDSFLFFGKPEQKARAAAYLPHIKGQSYEYTRCKTRKTQIAAALTRLITVFARPAYARTQRFARLGGRKTQIAAVFIRLIAVSVRSAHARTRRFARPKARKTQIAAALTWLIAISVRLLYHNFTGFSRDNSTAAAFISVRTAVRRRAFWRITDFLPLSLRKPLTGGKVCVILCTT